MPQLPQTTPQQRPQILFYDRGQAYYEFTNFSPNTVKYQNKEYPTSEHLFQAFKFMKDRPDIAENIRNSQSPRAAFDEAHKQTAYVRSDWQDVKIAMMDMALELKFTQDEGLKKMLLSTGEAQLVEDSPHDPFWGVGKKRDGRNELGKALERLRTKIRSERPVILFYKQHLPHYGFTNLSPHPVGYDGEMYPTSEHLFQAFKFLEYHPDVAKIIQLARRPIDAWAEVARHKAKIRADWPSIKIEMMDIVLWQKFNQFPLLKKELLATGDAELVEDSPEDEFWGRGKNHQGRNELGKALGRLRTKLRKV
ncbi:hypothetical protein C8R44DRAFT_12370 [Mycena epipterygia]|nr:hypothetical protein C8R44DRAFT_12370 [Mycena epipterygia]